MLDPRFQEVRKDAEHESPYNDVSRKPCGDLHKFWVSTYSSLVSANSKG